MAVFTKKLRKHIFVHPGEQHKLEAAIKIALLKDRRKYLDSLEGALLDVNKIQVVGDRHLVVNGYVSMEVVADFEVFSPSIGTELEGIINKKNGKNYGCVVKGLFNAYLHGPDDFSMTAQEGDNCSFTVTKVIVSGDIIFMNGRLKSVTPLLGPQDISGEQYVSPLSKEAPELTSNHEVACFENPEDKLQSENSSTNKKQVLPNNTSSIFLSKSIKSEPKDTPEEENSVSSETKPKKKDKKKIKSEINTSTRDEIKLPPSIFIKREPGEIAEKTSVDSVLSTNKPKKKKKDKSEDNGDCDSSMNVDSSNQTHTKSGKKRKHQSMDEGKAKYEEESFDKKPVIGVDVPNFSPTKELSPVKVKQEKLTPVKHTKVKSEPLSPPKKKSRKKL